MEEYNCDHCQHYSWYYDKCLKWNCQVDAHAVHNCFEPILQHPVRDMMVNPGGYTNGKASDIHPSTMR